MQKKMFTANTTQKAPVSGAFGKTMRKVGQFFSRHSSSLLLLGLAVGTITLAGCDRKIATTIDGYKNGKKLELRYSKASASTMGGVFTDGQTLANMATMRIFESELQVGAKLLKETKPKLDSVVVQTDAGEVFKTKFARQTLRQE